MEEEYLEPTPRVRRLLLAFAAACVLLAAIWSLWAEDAFYAYIHSLPICEQLPWWRALLLSVLASVFVAAALAARYARQLFVHGQDPPAGTWVFRRTRITRGAKVRHKAYQVSAIALASFLIGFYCAHLLTQLLFFQPVEKCAPGQRHSTT